MFRLHVKKVLNENGSNVKIENFDTILNILNTFAKDRVECFVGKGNKRKTGNWKFFKRTTRIGIEEES